MTPEGPQAVSKTKTKARLTKGSEIYFTPQKYAFNADQAIGHKVDLGLHANNYSEIKKDKT
jgi:hypothetical protein